MKLHNRLVCIEQWLSQLSLRALNQDEIQTLQELPPQADLEPIYEDFLRLCTKRYQHSGFWPDLDLLNLPFDFIAKALPFRPRIFCIGIGG